MINIDDDLRTAVSLMFTHGVTWLACVDDDGFYKGYVTQRTHHERARRDLSGRLTMAAARIMAAAKLMDVPSVRSGMRFAFIVGRLRVRRLPAGARGAFGNPPALERRHLPRSPAPGAGGHLGRAGHRRRLAARHRSDAPALPPLRQRRDAGRQSRHHDPDAGHPRACHVGARHRRAPGDLRLVHADAAADRPQHHRGSAHGAAASDRGGARHGHDAGPDPAAGRIAQRRCS